MAMTLKERVPPAATTEEEAEQQQRIASGNVCVRTVCMMCDGCWREIAMMI